MYGKSILSFVRHNPTVFQSGRTICIPTSSGWEFLLLHTLTSVRCCQCSGFGHCNRCVVVSCCFSLHFPDDIWWGPYFHMFTCHLYIFFSKVSINVFGPLLSCLFSYCWISKVLCIFWITVLYQICVLQIFSPKTVACLLILLIVSFAEQRFFF